MSTTEAEMLEALQRLSGNLEGKLGDIDDRVDTLIPSIAGTLVRHIYVDPVNGDDANTGAEANPLKTLDGCNAVMNDAGAYVIFLTDNVVVDSRVFLEGGFVQIAAVTPNVKVRMDWANQIDGANTGSPTLRPGRGFSHLSFRDIIFGNTVSAAHVTAKRMIDGNEYTNVHTWRCEWDTAAGDDLPFIFTTGQTSLWVLSGTVPAEQAGSWINDVAAGSDPATVPHLVNTNLATL